MRLELQRVPKTYSKPKKFKPLLRTRRGGWPRITKAIPDRAMCIRIAAHVGYWIAEEHTNG